MPALVVLATIACLLGGSPASAAGETDSVLVSGRGEVFGAPDTAVANFAVETTASTVDAAMSGADAAAIRMRDALVHAGIARADLQTTDVSIRSKQNENEKVTGYVASHGLTAKIRDLPRAGAVMSAAIAAGGDAARLNGVSFAIEDRAALLDEARRKAFADARAKAELYAAQAGRPLGRVVKVSEEAPGYVAPMAHYALAADAAMPVEPGRQGLTVTVTVEWAFGNSHDRVTERHPAAAVR